MNKPEEFLKKRKIELGLNLYDQYAKLENSFSWESYARSWSKIDKTEKELVAVKKCLGELR